MSAAYPAGNPTEQPMSDFDQLAAGDAGDRTRIDKHPESHQ
jgi:hypothetical protein